MIGLKNSYTMNEQRKLMIDHNWRKREVEPQWTLSFTSPTQIKKKVQPYPQQQSHLPHKPHRQNIPPPKNLPIWQGSVYLR